jgi:hypothetical protein
MVFKKPVLTLILIFLLVFGLGLASAEAQFWPFGKKKEQASTQDDNRQSVFNMKGKEGAAGNTWSMNSKKSAEGKDVVVNGVTIKGLKEEMMYSSYAPKSAEEIGAIALAHNSWQESTVNEMQQAAEQRMAAADLRSQQGLANLQAGRYAQPGPVMNAREAGTGNATEKPVKRQIYNKPILTKPSKVFTDYR